ncbi:hypothetical protein [Streptomyces sp. NPDC059446]|uniref:hypothetical protein n=1 Tax=Streptomyces sp. NPDC059446 TaxID=3346833 RepID=UPI0036A5BF7D
MAVVVLLSVMAAAFLVVALVDPYRLNWRARPPGAWYGSLPPQPTAPISSVTAATAPRNTPSRWTPASTSV